MGFLENDVDHIEHNVHAADLEPLEVVIEPPIQYSTSSSSTASDLQTNEQNLYVKAKLSKEIKYRWKKIDPISEVSSAILNNNIEFEYGQILLPLEKTATPFEIFKKVSKFDQFLIDIVIPETILYSQQQGHVFEIELDEMKAFFGMTVVMGYHVLPSLRLNLFRSTGHLNYWSSEPDLGVPFIANIMTRKRFEEIRSLLNFNDNNLLLPATHFLHDRAFKIRPILEHFNSAFITAMAPTKCQSIDEHMIKFKGHNILRQYVKGKPIKWGYKM